MRKEFVIPTAFQEILDWLQVSYHLTPAFPDTTATAAISFQLTLGILIGFVEEYISSITEAAHQGALTDKKEDNGNQTFHDKNLILKKYT